MNTFNLFKEFIKYHSPSFKRSIEFEDKFFFCDGLLCIHCKVIAKCSVKENRYITSEDIKMIKDLYPEYFV